MKHIHSKRELVLIGIKKNLKNILIIVLIIANLLTVFVFINRESNLIKSYKNPYPLIDFARNFVDKENFIVNIQPLREYLYDYVDKSKPNLVSIYLEFLNTGANISINTDSRFWPASLSKVPAAMVVLKKVERGEWKLNNELVLFEEDKDSRYGELYKKSVGTRFTIEELIKEMVINSDNTALKIFVRNLSSNSFDEIIETLGLEGLYNKEYDISAKEYSRIFRALYNSSFLEPNYSQLLLEWLSESQFEEYLAGAVPNDILFSHKIGEQIEQNTYLDSGIVYVPNRPYMITVLVKIQENAETTDSKALAEKFMQDISKNAYEYITKI